MSKKVIDLRPEYQVADYLSRTRRGASVNTLGEAPSGGFMVRYGTFPTLRLPWLDSAAILRYVFEHWQAVSQRPDAYFGIWTDSETGYVYLDVTAEFLDRELAISRARQLGEMAVYDVVLNTEVRVQ